MSGMHRGDLLRLGKLGREERIAQSAQVVLERGHIVLFTHT